MIFTESIAIVREITFQRNNLKKRLQIIKYVAVVRVIMKMLKISNFFREVYVALCWQSFLKCPPKMFFSLILHVKSCCGNVNIVRTLCFKI